MSSEFDQYLSENLLKQSILKGFQGLGKKDL